MGFDFLRQTIMKSIDIDEYSGSDKPVILAAHPAYLINTAAKEWLMETYDGSYGENPAIGSGGVPHEAWSEAGYAEMGTEYRRSVVVDGYFADKTDELADVIHGAMEELAASGQTTFSSHVIGGASGHSQDSTDGCHRMTCHRTDPLRNQGLFFTTSRAASRISTSIVLRPSARSSSRIR